MVAVPVVYYLDIISTRGADGMSDHDEWISYSQWGMFTPGTKILELAL